VNEDQIKELLESVDRAAGLPSYGPVSAAGIRRRVHRRQTRQVAFPLAAAALLLLSFSIWSLTTKTPQPSGSGSEERIASLEEQVRQLQTQTESALRLVQDVLAQERQQQRLDALEAELASIRDPRQEMQAQADEAAFALVYQADRFYRELNQTQSAIEAYEQVIRVFPESRWADEAKARLARIKRQEPDKI
jgi:tetratricopeptide (TPR) repeat protein